MTHGHSRGCLRLFSFVELKKPTIDIFFQNLHYDSIAVYLCLSEMGNTAGNCSLKAPFIPMGISFGGHRKRGAQLRFLSFQKR